MADLKPQDIDLAELHDTFEILELAESEDADETILRELVPPELWQFAPFLDKSP